MENTDAPGSLPSASQGSAGAQQIWLFLWHLLQADFHSIKVIPVIFKDKEFNKSQVALFAFLFAGARLLREAATRLYNFPQHWHLPLLVKGNIFLYIFSFNVEKHNWTRKENTNILLPNKIMYLWTQAKINWNKS